MYIHVVLTEAGLDSYYYEVAADQLPFERFENPSLIIFAGSKRAAFVRGHESILLPFKGIHDDARYFVSAVLMPQELQDETPGLASPSGPRLTVSYAKKRWSSTHPYCLHGSPRRELEMSR
jgi:hypothetical protein